MGDEKRYVGWLQLYFSRVSVREQTVDQDFTYEHTDTQCCNIINESVFSTPRKQLSTHFVMRYEQIHPDDIEPRII